MLQRLPVEILLDILNVVLHQPSSSKIAILSTCSLCYHVGLRILHRDLQFRSSVQLRIFCGLISAGSLSLAYEPQSLSLDIAGGDSTGIFDTLYPALAVIITDPNARKDEDGRLILESFQLRLNSHLYDRHHERIYTCLSLVNPTHFIWTGPDPPHHFSIAIVPPAVPYLFQALASYTRLSYLKLTNIAFPVLGDEATLRPIELPYIPTLRTFHLGQTTFLAAQTIAGFILNSLCFENTQNTGQRHDSQLQHLQLVDVYEGSIWGLRLRVAHIVAAAMMILADPSRSSGIGKGKGELLDLIARLVTVNAQTERIMGGDRDTTESSDIDTGTRSLVDSVHTSGYI